MLSIEFSILLIGVAAFLYSSVGHGGASGYLAIMAIMGFSPLIMKPTALILNIVVSSVSFLHFYKSNHFKFQLFVPFALGSIPFAYLGGTITVNDNIYRVILGTVLLFAVVRMLMKIDKPLFRVDKSFAIKMLFGCIIGFFSGLIGIGGGIILSPVILLFNWGTIKQAAAVSSLFILVNSISGFIGMYSDELNLSSQIYWMVGVTFIGGLLGGYLGSRRFSNKSLTYLLSFILLAASIKLLFL